MMFLAVPALAFQMNSGYYVGKGVGQSITGLGFQPDLVIIIPEIGNRYAVFRTSAMSDGQGTAFFAAATDNFIDGVVSLDSGGFSIGDNDYVSTVNVRYTWVAFSGSGGTDFKVGSYVGNATDDRSISDVGFQPDLVVVKHKGTQRGCWKTSVMTGETTEFFYASNGDPANAIQTIEATGFQIGTDAYVNSLNDTYWYFAFKAVTGEVDVGLYTGNGAPDRSIGGVGFQPDLIWTKGDDTTVVQHGVLRTDQSYGDDSQLFYGGIQTNHIQSLEANGFEIGTNARVNESGKTYYYAAFTGVPTPQAASGHYTVANGEYSGTGAEQSVSGLGFRPDLVIIKSGAGNYYANFATSDMPVGYAAYFGNNGLFTGGITINSDGFTVGTSTNVNAAATTYYYTAFANAGSADFKVGAYTGNAEDNRSITGIGFQPNMVTTRRYNTNYAVWRNSSMAGDTSSYFAVYADSSNLIQALENDGFQVGSGNEVNYNDVTYYYFAFKEGTGYFKAGTYTGNAPSNQTITGLSGRSHYLWVKSASTDDGMSSGSNIPTGYSQYLRYGTNVTNRIEELLPTSFEVGTDDDVNNSGRTYWYAAWLSAPASLEFSVQPTGAEVGDPITPAPTVRVTDQFGNLIDYDNSTSITVSLFNPGAAILSGTKTATVVNGIATFEGLSIDVSATGYIMQATAGGFPTVYSNAFNIGPGQGNRLAFVTQPNTTEALQTMTPSVQVAVKDSYGNTVTTDNTSIVTVAIGTNPVGGTLSGTLTRTVVAGVAAFDDLSIDQRGEGYTLTASAPYIQTVTSEVFDITAEATAPAIISYAPSTEGVSLESKSSVTFSEAMYQTSVQNAFSFKAVRDNQGAVLDTPITGTFAWTSPEVVEFSPGASLVNNYTYQTAVSAEAEDLVGNKLSNPGTSIFTTIATTGSINAFVGEDGVSKIVFPAGALSTAFYVKVSSSPEVDPIIVDPTKIAAATTKVAAEGNKFKFLLAGSAKEFVAYDGSGARITGGFNSPATLTLGYTDVGGDGVVDGTDPPIRATALRVCRLDETNSLWVVYPDSTVDTSAKTVSIPVSSLSVYGLMARAAESVVDAYAYPNPFKPSDGHTNITFTNLASVCTIKIFTTSGSLVRTIRETDGDSQSVWDVTNDAGERLLSGLYIYIIRSSDDSKTGKLVIIR